MFLGLDLGTTNVKALVTDRAGRLLAHASSPVQLFYVGDGGVEQDIEEIVGATLSAMRQVADAVDSSGIEAIGVSSQGGALQVLDRYARPLGRVVSWLDQRGQSFDRKLTDQLQREWFVRRIHRGCSGLGIGQLLRLGHEDPELIRPPNRVGFVGDVVVSRLCGRPAHDGTSCGLTLLYNPQLRDYDPDLLERLQLDASQLPELISPREIAGGLQPEVARATGLRAGIPVSAAVHDQYASALGTGAVRAGTVMVGTGTAWVLLAVRDRLTPPVIDEAFVCNHLIEGLYGQILSLVNGGSSLTWALHLMGLGEKGAGEIEALLQSSQPGSAGLSFWPFLVSSGVSGLVPGTRGKLSGLQLAHRPSDVVRSVIEGLVFELNRYLGFLRSAGWPLQRLVMGGGAASSQVTPQIIADVTGLPVCCLTSSEASLRGAAILARGLIDRHTPLADLSESMVPPARRVDPGVQATCSQEQYQNYLRSLPLQQARHP